MLTCGAIALDPTTQTLSGPRGSLVLGDRQFLVLRLLILRPGAFVNQAQLIETIWPDPDQEPDSSFYQLRHIISAIRHAIKALGGLSDPIRSEARVGYALRVPHRLPTDVGALA